MQRILSVLLMLFAGTTIITAQTQSTATDIPFSTHTGISVLTRPAISNDTIIKWSESRKLTWNNFQGKPPVPAPFDAASCIEIDWKPERINGKIIFNVYAGFNTKSYTTSSSLSCLAHEQLHFDMCEVYARMIRKYIADFNGKIPDSVDGGDMMNHYFLSLREMMKSEGARYDIETNHGLNKTKQAEWKLYIETKLKELEQYK